MFDNDKKDYLPDFDATSVIEKFLTVCLPVTTTPNACIGKIKTECCGSPIISLKPPFSCCDEMKNGTCDFTVVQKMKVEIPITFSASTKVNDLFVDCEYKKDCECD